MGEEYHQPRGDFKLFNSPDKIQISLNRVEQIGFDFVYRNVD